MRLKTSDSNTRAASQEPQLRVKYLALRSELDARRAVFLLVRQPEQAKSMYLKFNAKSVARLRVCLSGEALEKGRNQVARPGRSWPTASAIRELAPSLVRRQSHKATRARSNRRVAESRQLNLSFQLDADGVSDLQVLWDDGERVFCRGWRADEGSRSAALAVLPAADRPPRPSSIASLTNTN